MVIPDVQLPGARASGKAALGICNSRFKAIKSANQKESDKNKMEENGAYASSQMRAKWAESTFVEMHDSRGQPEAQKSSRPLFLRDLPSIPMWECVCSR